MNCIGISYDREANINPSGQFQFKKSCKRGELKRLLNEKGYKMKSILRMNTILMSNNVEEQRI